MPGWGFSRARWHSSQSHALARLLFFMDLSDAKPWLTFLRIWEKVEQRSSVFGLVGQRIERYLWRREISPWILSFFQLGTYPPFLPLDAREHATLGFWWLKMRATRCELFFCDVAGKSITAIVACQSCFTRFLTRACHFCIVGAATEISVARPLRPQCWPLPKASGKRPDQSKPGDRMNCAPLIGQAVGAGLHSRRVWLHHRDYGLSGVLFGSSGAYQAVNMVQMMIDAIGPQCNG